MDGIRPRVPGRRDVGLGGGGPLHSDGSPSLQQCGGQDSLQTGWRLGQEPALECVQVLHADLCAQPRSFQSPPLVLDRVQETPPLPPAQSCKSG